MKNDELKKISGLIRKDWEDNILDVKAVERYAGLYGYCFSTAKEFSFDEYLEEYSERGKTTRQWDGLVDSVMLKNGYQIDDICSLSDLDYQLIWGYINHDIDDHIEANISLDALGLAMIK